MLQAPFPYFGGKSPIAKIVWKALGQPKHYIEPFFGSGAVLLARPEYNPRSHIETVCDKDGFLANVWRSLQFNPDEVARWCDWPVNHADLNARRKVLLSNESRLLENLITDDKWHDPVMAGYWIWAASCWIGAGLTRLDARPHIASGGVGVHKLAKRHIFETTKQSVQDPYNISIYEWFRQLSERLRNVRVVCGDWTRVCGGNWQDSKGICGIFMDPPYGVEDRNKELYYYDSTEIAKDVLAWCKERGQIETYRIVIAGYEEYQELLNDGWTYYKWKSHGGYALTSRSSKQNNQGKINRNRETLYFSPYCQSIKKKQ